MSRSAHPAGPRHADVLPEQHPSHAPADLNHLDAAIWPISAERVRGEITLADVSVTVLAERYGTPVVVIDETDVRRRARDSRDDDRRAQTRAATIACHTSANDLTCDRRG